LVLVLVGLSSALAVLGAVPSVLAFAMFPLLRFCSATTGPIAADYVNRHSPQHLRATMASIASMAASVVMAVMAPLMGAVADHSSLEASFLAGAAVVLTLGSAAFVAWALASRTERATGQPRDTAVEVA
jgi:MFS family permease